MTYLKYLTKAILLPTVLVSSSWLDHREKPPPDTLASEVTDQADPEFKLLSKGDNCISQDDLLEFVESQLPPPPDCDPGVPPGHCKQEMAEYHEIKEAMVSYGITMHAYADRCVTGEEDGCVDEKEFVTMNEMEGPPPGFEEEAAEGMVEGDMEPAHSAPGCAFFDADGDGKISKKEAVAKSKELGEDDMSAEFMANVYQEFMDKDGDSMVSCKEYDDGMAAMETEAGRDRLAEAMETTMLKQQDKVKEVECDMMDDNGDGMISQSEIYQYVHDMQGADLSQETLHEIVEAADKNEDGFVQIEECINAGKEYDGDGPGFVLQKRHPLDNVEDNDNDDVGYVGLDLSGKSKSENREVDDDDDNDDDSWTALGLRFWHKVKKTIGMEAPDDKDAFLQKSAAHRGHKRHPRSISLVPMKLSPKLGKRPVGHSRVVNMWRLLADVKASPKIHWRPEFRWLLYRIPSLKKFAGFVIRRGATIAHRLHLKPKGVADKPNVAGGPHWKSKTLKNLKSLKNLNLK